MSKVVIYTTDTCPKCKLLKKYFELMRVQYEEADMSTPEALTELRFNNIFSLTAPVLQVDNTFLTAEQIFDGNAVREEIDTLTGI
jgi:glutaredoxin